MMIERAHGVRRWFLAAVALAAVLSSLAPSSASAYSEWLGCAAVFGDYGWEGSPGNMSGCRVSYGETFLVPTYMYVCPEDVYLCYYG